MGQMFYACTYDVENKNDDYKLIISLFFSKWGQDVCLKICSVL